MFFKRSTCAQTQHTHKNQPRLHTASRTSICSQTHTPALCKVHATRRTTRTASIQHTDCRQQAARLLKRHVHEPLANVRTPQCTAQARNQCRTHKVRHSKIAKTTKVDDRPPTSLALRRARTPAHKRRDVESLKTNSADDTACFSGS